MCIEMDVGVGNCPKLKKAQIDAVTSLCLLYMHDGHVITYFVHVCECVLLSVRVCMCVVYIQLRPVYVYVW